MLEVYLRRVGFAPAAVGEVLQQRDLLLRSLAADRRYSVDAIAAHLWDSAAEEHDLELAMVASMRALGFVAKHVSGSGEPDGVARLVDYDRYPQAEVIITLEAKSSAGQPTLNNLDFAAAPSHREKHNAIGTIMIAPSYPGAADPDSEVSIRAVQTKVSCWTVKQLGEIVKIAEARHISAKQILAIILESFRPMDVTERIERLLSDPVWRQDHLYRAIIDVLKALRDTAIDSPRSVGMVVGALASNSEFRQIKHQEVHAAVSNLAAASKGTLLFRPENGTILVNADWEEIERRVSALTNRAVPLRKPGMFRE